MDALSIEAADPLSPDLDALFERHAAHCNDTAAECRHMLPRAALRDPQVTLYALREAGRALAMGALKRLGDASGEIKSMHVLAETRGRGAGRAMLAHLTAQARAMGLTRLFLETGATPGFDAARALYAAADFAPCGPFGAYPDDPRSVFMVRALDA